MLNKFIVALLISSATIFTASMAQADSTGFFIAGGANYAQFDSDLEDEIDWEDDIEAFFDDKAVGYNLGAGYRFNKWLALDVAYWDLGEFTSDDLDNGEKIKYDSSMWTVGGIVSVPLWILDVYGRAGATMWEADSRYIDEDGTDAYYGAGVALNVFRSLDLYLEYVRFDTDNPIDSANLGLRWTF